MQQEQTSIYPFTDSRDVDVQNIPIADLLLFPSSLKKHHDRGDARSGSGEQLVGAYIRPYIVFWEQVEGDLGHNTAS